MEKNKKMKAVGFFKGRPLGNNASIIDTFKVIPIPEPQDILVKVKAVSVNPVDVKLRNGEQKQSQFHVLGFDGVGEVVSVGERVKKFAIGDRVFYAGTTKRAGSNQEFQLVNEEIAALAPKNLSDEEAAALPLTSLTAYELLFEKFNLIPRKNANQGKKIVVVNGAGGVGSILTQLAHWTGMTVYATSSPENFDWLKRNGVDHPLDYHKDLTASLEEFGIESVDYAAILFNIVPYFASVAKLISPFGHIGTIVELNKELNLSKLKNKSVSFDWEYMFAKTDFNYRLETQGAALALIAQLAEEQAIITTVSKTYEDGINAINLKKAYADVEAGHMRGKVVVSGPFNGEVKWREDV